MVSWPLLTPQTFLRDATSCGRASKRELRGLVSGRLDAYGTHGRPEVSLCALPRITVRGHPVQGVRFVLRKAPLRSIAVPWSIKHIWRPLAFSRATEGRRGSKESFGESRGGKETIGVLSPFCPCRWAPTPPRPWGTASLASSGAPLYRRKGLPSASDKAEKALIACGGRPPERRNRLPSADGKKRENLLFPVSSDIMIYRGYSPLFRGGSTRRIHQ